MTMGTEYHKIPGPFKREYGTSKLTEEWSTPELAYLAECNAPWEAREKVDGMNVRVIWDGHRVHFGGRTQNAQLPPKLFEWLYDKFAGETNEVLFEQLFGADPVVLYGEGYGPKINGGGKYRDDISVVFYDIMIDGFWLQRPNVEDIAHNLGIDVVPIIAKGTLRELIALVSSGLESHWGGGFGLAGARDYFTAEGVVAVTTAGLLARNGQRVVVKIKTRDFSE